jgi:hypothetical protein
VQQKEHMSRQNQKHSKHVQYRSWSCSCSIPPAIMLRCKTTMPRMTYENMNVALSRFKIHTSCVVKQGQRCKGRGEGRGLIYRGRMAPLRCRCSNEVVGMIDFLAIVCVHAVFPQQRTVSFFNFEANSKLFSFGSRWTSAHHRWYLLVHTRYKYK